MLQSCVPKEAAFQRCLPAKKHTRVSRCRSINLVRASVPDGEDAVPAFTRRAGLVGVTAGLILASNSLLLPEAATAGNTTYIEVNSLSTFQKGGQRKQMLNRAINELKKVLTVDDAPLAVRLVLADASTYDISTGTGGINGSIILSDELNRSENAPLKPLVAKLETAKKAIDEGAAAVGQAPISWADIIVVAGKVATELAWVDAKIKRAVYESGGRTIAEQFGTEFPVSLGRVDATTSDNPTRLPPDGASVQDIKNFMLSLGANPPGDSKPSFLASKPPFWERPTFVLYTAAALNPTEEEQRFAEADDTFKGLKKKYDMSRRTVTRTDYEVDFIDYYTKLANLGAKYDPNRYLYRIKLDVPNKF